MAEAQVSRGPGQPVPGQAGGEQRAPPVVAAQVGAEQGADAGQLAVVAGAREQLVDGVYDLVVTAAGRRLDPATVMAIPDSTRDSASTVRKSSSFTVPGWCSTACAAVRAMATASPSTGSPRSAAASSQSAIADRLFTTSPIPARTRRGGPERTRSRSTITATGGTTPYELLPDSCSSELTGEAMPSCDRLVATATIGMPAMWAANLVTSMVLPPPMPATAS